MTFVLRDREATTDAPLGGKARALAALQGNADPALVRADAGRVRRGEWRPAVVAQRPTDARRRRRGTGERRRLARGALLGVRRGRAAALVRGPARQLPLRAARRRGRQGGRGLALRLQRPHRGLPPRAWPRRRRRGRRPCSCSAWSRRRRPASPSGPTRSAADAGWPSSAPSAAWAPPSSPATPTPTRFTSIGTARSSYAADRRQADRPPSPRPAAARASAPMPVPSRTRRAARPDRRAGPCRGRTGAASGPASSAGRRTSNGPSRAASSICCSRGPSRRWRRTADPDGVLNLWDNSNIAESYNGITTPLTFSFARRIYEEVYRQFCRILRVPDAAASRRSDESSATCSA